MLSACVPQVHLNLKTIVMNTIRTGGRSHNYFLQILKEAGTKQISWLAITNTSCAQNVRIFFPRFQVSWLKLAIIAVPPSPSDTCSSSYTDTASSSCSQPILVVCNAPLVAPIPLPYHSPTFLQFELPDIDQDLSRPPYTHRSYKRKRTKDDDVEARSVASKQTLASSPRQPSRQRPSSRDSTRRKRPQHPSR